MLRDSAIPHGSILQRHGQVRFRNPARARRTPRRAAPARRAYPAASRIHGKMSSHPSFNREYWKRPLERPLKLYISPQMSDLCCSEMQEICRLLSTLTEDLCMDVCHAPTCAQSIHLKFLSLRKAPVCSPLHSRGVLTNNPILPQLQFHLYQPMYE